MRHQHSRQEPERHANRLTKETSPYLLQHAHNPVDWYPWGPEAFEAARDRGVPIFLSVGYSTCYWCHVMERESFEDEATARVMNEHFVNIKVDREERPDVDDIYMAATQALTGAGGWPMSVFLEPERLRPFHAGTYYPPEPRFNRPGFTQVLQAISNAWKTRRDDVMTQAEALANAVREQLAAEAAPVPVGEAQVTQATTQLLQVFDPTEGGFARAPRFPQPVFLEFLLDVRRHADDPGTQQSLDEALRRTLDAMAIGGMRDQVGGGFHRYSTDATWTVPHFEKMLYDNGQLAAVYARAARLYEDEYYARIVRTTLDYVIREMTDPAGAFWSAQDAEVDHREGLNYLWKPDEIREVLSDDDAAFALTVYGLDRGTNFQDPHHPEDEPSNVLRLDARPAAVAERMGIEPAAFLETLDRVRAQLYDARRQRKQPGTDDKVLSSWNGLMLQGVAEGHALLGDQRFAHAATTAADFFLSTMIQPDGTLLRAYRDRTARQPGFLEDYTHLAAGLIAMHRAGLDPGGRYLDAAKSLMAAAKERFQDADSGGYYDTLADQTDLFVRTRSTHDGAVPCGSSYALNNLISLHELTGENQYLDDAVATLRAASAAIARSPVYPVNSTRGLLRLLAAGAPSRHPGPFATGADAAEGEIDSAGAGGPGASTVEIFADTETLTIGRDSPASMTLALRIASGFHIVAADPGPAGEGLVPLRVAVAGGTGVRVYAGYPEGQPYGENTDLGEIRVHFGQVEFEVAVELQGEWSGKPRLAITYQVCTDTECRQPVTTPLGVEIKRAE